MYKKRSVEMENRRAFFKKVLGVIGFGAVALKSGAAFAKKMAIRLDKVPSLTTAGGSATIKLGGQEILLIRHSASELRAVSSLCTHQRCGVKYNPKTAKLNCACHGSVFDLSGKVLTGPATKNLTSFPASLDGERIIITVE
jgi:nitrite reductase/ring-hydroxylating ferredoxin subunit